MLKRLGIRNYALIESVDLEFGRGLTVITGETGSGKSIMLGALSLLTGNRADARVAGGGKSRVEAVFEDVDESMRNLLEEKGIDWVETVDDLGMRHNEISIRREIAAEGRSKVYINDTSVTLSTLQTIGTRLVYIHSQHANSTLADPLEQLKTIDVFADCGALLENYREQFRHFADIKRKIDAIKARIAKSRENEEFLRFQCGQLDTLKPRRGELAEIEKRYEVLSDADAIKEQLSALSQLLGQPERGLVAEIYEARAMVDKLDFALFGKNAEESDIPARMEVLQTELKDIADTIEDINAAVNTDPAALEKLSGRMQDYYNAVKHFRVGAADELVDLHEKLKRELSEIEYGGEELPNYEREARMLARRLKELADEITASRREGARIFSEKILTTARTLGLPNLRFEAVINPVKLGSTGQDRVEFLCAFNRNAEMRFVGETASGGEMSRLMLSIKGVMADRMNMPTIVFDEVDTGVSGEIAERMGKMMRGMGDSIQVMAITHLPQVASQGLDHFKVYKRDEADRTVTHVERLRGESRVREIASMISGSVVTDAALENARALMKDAGCD